jgi:riboflavin synthase
MFTGLVEAVGVVAMCRPEGTGARLRLETPLAGELAPGDSLAVNGVCLTAVQGPRGCVDADVGPETLRVTTLGRLTTGQLVNLERPLRADGRFGGHFVLGHVDGVGRVEAVQADGDSRWVTVSFPSALSAYLIPKGSIAVDGISLTIARLHADRFDVQIVPFTFEHTNLRGIRVHDPVNLECDMVGKYVVRAVEVAGLAQEPRRPAGVSS